MEKKYVPNLKREYLERIVPALMQKFGYKSIMQVPRLEKIVLSRGIGEAIQDKKQIENSVQEFTLIAGQKAVVTKAKKDISNFKLRKGYPIGCKVTLRGDRMYEFLERLIVVAIPRTRDFRGLPLKGFDGRGNFTMGVKEQIIFPEIDVDKISKISGLDITIVTTSKEDKDAMELLKEFGMPFKTK
ncbi:MAG: 50S ribosomal protein L5 [Candidatus Omnitrophica bacterium]|nr:50S ribosomal protein L5 [Candidatus Omnitrophota bacterium]